MTNTKKSSKASGGKPKVATWPDVVSALELRSIRADEVVLQVDRVALTDEAQEELKVLSKLEGTILRSQQGEIAISFTLEVIVPRDEATSTSQQPLIRLLLKYGATYSIPKDLSVKEDLLSIIRDRLAIFHVFPFLRAHVVDLTARAGLPPLVLPLVKIPENEATAPETD